MKCTFRQCLCMHLPTPQPRFLTDPAVGNETTWWECWTCEKVLDGVTIIGLDTIIFIGITFVVIVVAVVIFALDSHTSGGTPTARGVDRGEWPTHRVHRRHQSGRARDTAAPRDQHKTQVGYHGSSCLCVDSPTCTHTHTHTPPHIANSIRSHSSCQPTINALFSSHACRLNALNRVASTGSLEGSADYSHVAAQVQFVTENGEWGLLESLGATLARLLLEVGLR